MRLSQYFLPTLKENPAEAQITSHRLMLRAGFINQTTSGIYTWLPMGERVLKRMKVVGNDRWLNKHDNMSPPINPFGNLAMRRPENRAKARLNNTGEGNPMFGKKHRRLTCQHCSKEVAINAFNIWHGSNCETINPDAKNLAKLRNSGTNNPMYGKKQKIKKCECCSKQVSAPNYVRWHGNKCKSNLTSSVGNTDKTVYNNLVGSI
jgi:hypothetical protein